MGLLDYQRTIVGYHGTDAQVVERVLAGKEQLEYSRNKHDWLGRGIYFWEHGPRRAVEWAEERSKGLNAGKIKTPAVIGAFINLGHCFDLLDTRYTRTLSEMFPLFRQSLEESGVALPENKSPAKSSSTDLVLRQLDCAMINWTLDRLKESEGVDFQTVRCVFTEGVEAFPKSRIMAKSHIQIAVREPKCILGYFRPNLDSASDGGLI